MKAVSENGTFLLAFRKSLRHRAR